MSLNTSLSDGFKENFAALEESIIKINTLKKNKDVAAIKEIDSAHNRINNLKQTALFQNPTARGALLDLDNRLSYEEIHPFSEEADLKDKRASIDECWKNCLKSDARIALSAKEKNLDTKSLEKMISKCIDQRDYANAIELAKLVRDETVRFNLANDIYDAVKNTHFELAEKAVGLTNHILYRQQKFGEIFERLFKAELQSQNREKLHDFVKLSAKLLSQITDPQNKEFFFSNVFKYLSANKNRTPEMMFTIIKTIEDPDRKIAELRKLTSAPLSESLSRDIIQELAVLKQSHGGQTSFVLNRIFEYAMKEENYALASAAATHITDQPDRHEALANLLENLKKANVEHQYDLLIVKTLKEFPLNETLDNFEKLIADPKLSAEAQREMTSQLSELVKQNQAEPIQVADENGYHVDLKTRLSKLVPALFEKAFERHDFENALNIAELQVIPEFTKENYALKCIELLDANDPKTSPDLRKKFETIGIRMALEKQNTIFLDILTASALNKNDYKAVLQIANLVASNPAICRRIKNDALLAMLQEENAKRLKLEFSLDQEAIKKANFEAWNRCKPLALEIEQIKYNPLPDHMLELMYLMATNAGDYSTSLMLSRRYVTSSSLNFSSRLLNTLLNLTPKEKIEHRDLLLEILNSFTITREQRDTLLKELYNNPDRDYPLIAATIDAGWSHQRADYQEQYQLWNRFATESRLAFAKELSSRPKKDISSREDIGFNLAATRYYAQTQDLPSAIQQFSQISSFAKFLPETQATIVHDLEIEIARRIKNGIIENRTQLSAEISKITKSNSESLVIRENMIEEMGERLDTLLFQKNPKVLEETFNEKISDMMLKDDPIFPIAFKHFLKAGNIENAMVALSRLKKDHDAYLDKFIRFLIVKAKQNKQTAADVYAEVEKIRSQIPLPINRLPSKDLLTVKEELENAEKKNFDGVLESEFQANIKTQADNVTTQQFTASESQANTKTQADKVTTQQASALKAPETTGTHTYESIYNKRYADWKSQIDKGFSSEKEWNKVGYEINSRAILLIADRAGLETKHRELLEAHRAAKPK